MFKINRIELFIANKCSNNCIFCSENSRFDNSELPFGFIIKVLKKEKKRGARLVHFMGGEPTLHSKFLEILHAAKNLNYQIYVISNGVMFTDKVFCNRAFEYIDDLCLSIQGPDEYVHNLHTGNKNSFKILIKAFKNVRKYYKKAFLVNVTITKHNAASLLDIFKVVSKYSPRCVRYLNLVPSGNAKNDYKNLVVNFSKLKQYILKLAEYSKESGIPLRFGGVPLCILGKDNFMYAFEVYEPEMRIGKRFKNDSEMCLWNREISTRKSISNFSSNIIDMSRIKIAKCIKCRLFSVCGGIFEEYLKIYGDKEFAPFK
ncbi:MAG: radical SAM protein [Candidatus Omnitrophota bacterium]|nr:radical SAM protein [Candidatus Omnitrophota bacterium]